MRLSMNNNSYDFGDVSILNGLLERIAMYIWGTLGWAGNIL